MKTMNEQLNGYYWFEGQQQSYVKDIAETRKK